ncbi:S-adenosyl-L-methionine-dependent methyltransferase [Guyanagaster necrorhizus]|uniref:S-adenosyl-L-methionine-dependent methyltransferase n=1 Tax=Guyanagaster necrorhizus TaxID=856835 RepID=A0A9P7W3S9_9AGAR|nr:S-adenosyl-L-methionine-dependent methyltransferase [Guyanagaster necrorhizus MCA 3950]KAG7451455.1 S-adenosyl-L-methionine-dependent methyltransferase [Guyanagaster necrorhizus MCA 3950]
MTSGATHLLSLTSLITASVQEIISIYPNIPHPDSTSLGIYDLPENVPPELTRAIQRVEAACAQLSCAVASPGHVVLNKTLLHAEPASLLVVTQARIADYLLGKPDGLHISELARLSGLDEGKLGRILRLLVTSHVFCEVKPNVFSNNRLSMKLLKSDPVSDTVCLLTDESLMASSYLNESMIAKDGSKTPFERATGLPFFEYHKTPEGKAKGDRFPRAMVGWGNVTGKGLLAMVYPWEQQPVDTTICDVAGGNGHVTMALMKAHPHLKVVLQDQEQVIIMGKQFWNQEYPEAVERERVQFVPFNFFQDTAAEGCDFYYIRSILRDWPDEQSFLILSNVRKAMKPSSRLIIHDTVLRQAVRTTSASPSQDATLKDVAPEPLLPNYGAARIRTYELDMIMMNLLGSAARTLDEFLVLCGKCNFKFEKLYEVGETDLIEFSPI